MSPVDIIDAEKKIINGFPNTYTYTKRMAEHLLVDNNKKKIPLLILRPSVIGASLDEPFPGWTDSIGLAGGLYLLGGLGILKELPGDPKNIADVVPVDIVTNQLLA